MTISFGLRNVSDIDAALAEMARVTRPGGRLVVCEFSHPTWRPLRTVYSGYLMAALPSVARRVSSNPDAYVYLAESIRAWPDQPALAQADRRRRLGRRRVVGPDLRHRRAAPGASSLLTKGTSALATKFFVRSRFHPPPIG